MTTKTATTTKLKAPKFTAEQFTATQFTSAADKAAFANGLARLIAGDFRATLFTKRVYEGLHLRFGHIAHYNLRGFYFEWMATSDRQVEFLDHLMDECSHTYGQTHLWDDVKDALMEHEDFLAAARAAAAAEHAAATESSERILLAALKARYES